MNKLNRIIQLMTHFPAYEEYADKPRPAFNWDTPDGTWVGIWGYDWAELVGKAVVKEYKGVDYEVWQMDNRADKYYEAWLENRLLHRKFPGAIGKYRPGLKKRNYNFSSMLLDYAKNELSPDGTVLLMPATVETPFTRKLSRVLRNKQITIIHYNFLNTSLLLPSKEFTNNPIRNLHRYLRNKTRIRHLNSIKYLLNSNDNSPEDIAEIKRKFKHIIHLDFNLGTELVFWAAETSKQQARMDLNLKNEVFIIFLSQRLVSEYQIDRLIEVVSKIRTNKQFVFIVSGHGNNEYENYLHDLCRKLNVEHLIKFVGYVTNEELRKYYTACDVFATLPSMFAGSNSAVKAMAMERPVVHVSIGVTYEFLKRNNAGVFVNPRDYSQWVKVFKETIDGRQIQIIPREKVVTEFSWDASARKLLNALEKANIS